MRYWNRLFAAFLSVSVLPLNWHTHYSRAFRTGTVLAHAVDAEYPGIREQEQILTRGRVTRPTKFYAGVSAPTECYSLGCRLGPSISLVSCEDERNATHGYSLSLSWTKSSLTIGPVAPSSLIDNKRLNHMRLPRYKLVLQRCSRRSSSKFLSKNSLRSNLRGAAYQKFKNADSTKGLLPCRVLLASIQRYLLVLRVGRMAVAFSIFAHFVKSTNAQCIMHENKYKGKRQHAECNICGSLLCGYSHY